jgi:hypothetical protein
MQRLRVSLIRGHPLGLVGAIEVLASDALGFLGGVSVWVERLEIDAMVARESRLPPNTARVGRSRSSHGSTSRRSVGPPALQTTSGRLGTHATREPHG